MKLSINGIVTNEYGQVLLIQRDDTRTWALPGGSLDAGELPDTGTAREVQEETGLKVLPVRLTAVYYIPDKPESHLNFTFRCLQRGGELATSEESLQVGWAKTNNLPRSLANIHRQRIEQAQNHTSGPPYWGLQEWGTLVRWGKSLLEKTVYPYKDWQRKRQGKPPYQLPPRWEMGAFAVIRNQAGEVLWVKRTDTDVWNLPGGGSNFDEPPWTTAVRETQEETGLTIRLTNLTSVNVYEGQNHLAFTFTAHIETGTLTTGPEAAGFTYFAPGEEPTNAIQQHIERAAEACSSSETTLFSYQLGPEPVFHKT